jgi:hypothetical protein
MREDNDVAEPPESDRRFEQRRLIEGAFGVVDRSDRSERIAGVERASFAGNDDVADSQLGVLRNVLERNARVRTGRDAPPAPTLYDRRHLALEVGDQQYFTTERFGFDDAADDAVLVDDTGARADAGMRAHVEGYDA